jgi:hypothetical protein
MLSDDGRMLRLAGVRAKPCGDTKAACCTLHMTKQYAAIALRRRDAARCAQPPHPKIVTSSHKVLPRSADNFVNQQTSGLSARAFNKGKHV